LNNTKSWSEKLFYILIILPFVILSFLTLGPFIYSAYRSLFHWVAYDPGNIYFLGLENYIDIFQSRVFWGIMGRTFYQVSTTIVIQLVLAMIFALLLNRDELFMTRLNKKVFLLPMMTAPVVVSLTWKMLLNADMGMINYFLNLFGIKSFNWLASYQLAMPSIILVDIWRSTPFMVIILLAGLQSLPKEPFEAAIVDGAKKWQTFRYITLPLLAPTIFVALLFRAMDAFRRFETIFIMTGGGPGRSTETLNVHTYFQAFEYLKLGYGSALAVVLVLTMLAIALLLIRAFRQ
jgi:multiple sugar transport system permease protein